LNEKKEEEKFVSRYW